MAVSKVIYKSSASATPATWMDVTQDTVTASTLLSDYTATKNDGTKISGIYTGLSLQTKTSTYTPTTSEQTDSILPDNGYALSSVGITVNPIPSAYIIPTGTLSISSNVSGIDVTSYASVDVAVSGASARLQSKAVSPSATTIVVLPDDGSEALVKSYGSNTGRIMHDSTLSIPADFSELEDGETYHVTGTWSVYYRGVSTPITFDTEIEFSSSGVTIPFTGASALSSVTLYPNAIMLTKGSSYSDDATVTLLEWNFYHDTEVYDGLSSVTVYGSPFVETVERTVSGVLSNTVIQKVGAYAFYSCTGLSVVSFPNCSSIGSRAFNYCIELSAVSFPNCTQVYDYAFSSCYKLTTAYLPCLSTISSYAFYNCSSLTGVTTAPLYNIGSSAFASCGSLSSVIFSTSMSGIGASAFMYTKLPALNLERINDIGITAFRYCYSLSEFTAGYVGYIRSSAFANCGLQRVSISSASPSILQYGTSAFLSCSSLSSVYISQNNSATYYSVAQGAFYSCINLKFACFIGARAFVGSSTFYKCNNLLSLYILTKSTAITTLGNTNAFTSTPISTYTTSTGGIYGSIFVPASMYSSYIAATNWITYSSRFVSMTDAEIETFLSNLT